MDMESEKNKLVVWGVGTSRTMRVHWLLHELGLRYETRRIESRTGETQSDEYSSINPRQKIPTLVDGDLVVTESAAIMRHLRRISDNLPYDHYQLSLQGQANYDEWLSFILMELDATSLYVVRRHRDLPDIYGEAENAVSSSIAYFEKMLNSVVDQVAGKTFIWGSTFSELDILMTVCLDWANFVGAQVPAQLNGYHQAIKSRPAHSAAAKMNFSDLKIPTR
jgi:glutathione S-transferase